MIKATCRKSILGMKDFRRWWIGQRRYYRTGGTRVEWVGEYGHRDGVEEKKRGRRYKTWNSGM